MSKKIEKMKSKAIFFFVFSLILFTSCRKNLSSVIYYERKVKEYEYKYQFVAYNIFIVLNPEQKEELYYRNSDSEQVLKRTERYQVVYGPYKIIRSEKGIEFYNIDCSNLPPGIKYDYRFDSIPISIDHLRSKSRDRAAINRVLCDKVFLNKSDTLFVFRNTEIYSGGDDALRRDGFYWLEYVSSNSGLPIRFEYYYEGEKEPRKVLKSKFLYR